MCELSGQKKCSLPASSRRKRSLPPAVFGMSIISAVYLRKLPAFHRDVTDPLPYPHSYRNTAETESVSGENLPQRNTGALCFLADTLRHLLSYRSARKHITRLPLLLYQFDILEFGGDAPAGNACLVECVSLLP